MTDYYYYYYSSYPYYYYSSYYYTYYDYCYYYPNEDYCQTGVDGSECELLADWSTSMSGIKAEELLTPALLCHKEPALDATSWLFMAYESWRSNTNQSHASTFLDQ